MVALMRNELGDLANRLGVSTETIQSQVGRLENVSLGTLKQLGEAYGAEALEENKYARHVLDSRVELPPFGYNPKPSDKRASLTPFVAGTYHQSRPLQHPSAQEPLTGLLSRRRSEGAKAGRLVQRSDAVRMAVGRMLGGEVVPDGRTDGVLSVRTTTDPGRVAAASGFGGNAGAVTGAVAGAGSSAGVGSSVSAMTSVPSMPSSSTLYDLFYAMDYEILMQAAMIGQQQTSGGTSTETASSQTQAQVMNVLLGGKGSLQGMLGSTQSVSGFTGDSPEAASAGDGVESVDLGVLRLKRMIDKRDQMVNAVKNVLDKWNQAAKGAIDNVKA
ncbi:MAG: hypothetical protein IPK13_26045 [Deltaproteobacteria bacterium]|nr:hypothetical protein [Deltaproteobacteria bacterium]